MKPLLLAACACLLACAPCAAQTEAEIEWVNRHFPAVFNELIPLGERAGVAYRARRDLHNNLPEYSLRLDLNYQTDQVAGVLRVADSATLFDQLLELHRRRPSESVETLKQQLKVKETRVSGADCPALKSAFLKFSRIQFRAPDPYLLILHPMVYEFEVSAPTGRMRLFVPEDDHPLVKWALAARRTVEACAARARRGR